MNIVESDWYSMGIKKLMELVREHAPDAIKQIDMSALAGKTVHVDASLIIYQACATKIENASGKQIAHIQTVLYKVASLISCGVRPVFVFDGAPPEQKRSVLESRARGREKMQRQIEPTYVTPSSVIVHAPIGVTVPVAPTSRAEPNANVVAVVSTAEQLDIANAAFLDTRQREQNPLANGISFAIPDVKKLLECLGVEYLLANGEADALVASEYSMTEDTDVLVFGAANMLSKVTSGKTPTATVISLDRILAGFNMTHDQFIDLCILLGCDYTGTAKGIGVKRAYSLMQRHHTIEAVAAASPKHDFSLVDTRVRDLFKVAPTFTRVSAAGSRAAAEQFLVDHGVARFTSALDKIFT